MKKLIILMALAIATYNAEAKKVGVVNATQYPMRTTINISGGGSQTFDLEPGAKGEYGTTNVLQNIDYKIFNKEKSATENFDFNNNQGWTGLPEDSKYSGRTFAGNTIGLYVVHQRDDKGFTVNYIEP